MSDKPVRVRIAPSPTGDPHVGTAYVGLINYAFARQNGGQFILRIEDTDQERSTRASEQAIFDALRWVGLSWDEGPDVGGPLGPYRQSERTEIYRKHVRDLIDLGFAYPCFCTPEELNAIRLRQRDLKQNTGYDGTCRHIPKDEAIRRMDAGETCVIRLKVPEGKTVVHDRLRGDVEIENSQVDDQILLKSDGFPTYHLANVVDDHLMGITHVIRAEEWISSTPKHLMLYEAFGWEPPTFVHLPLLRNHDKSKISKRKNPVSLLYFKQIGILPEAMLNFLAMLGHSMPDEREKFTLTEFVNEFSFDRISLGGPVFDLEKLIWLNGVHIREMDDDELARRIVGLMFTPEAMKPLIPLIKERIRTLGDYPEHVSYFNAPQIDVPLIDIWKAGKGMTTAQIAKMLKETVEFLDGIREFDARWLEEGLRTFCEQKEYQVKTLFMMLRLCITGRKATPPLFDVFVVLGKAAVGQRIRAAADAIAAWKPPAA
ncbi:MAG TPA: glutamate--tRNA ligase [Myxococcota bacterium]|nr:glutamate--tRNA ligase [Myxococcota bacterium]HOA13559.1 glutamate--tRNA ligase [Myxococcota bacterium]HOH76739.1 glutamate--tRNA ligase [Myxococcota bacterium]HPV03823.1 glutamate--tRNA ligase [Myxococcota bacterium]